MRTIKIKWGRYNYSGDEQPNIWDYFCNTRCLHDFLKLHATAIANIAPRREALETPVKVAVHTYDMGYRQGQKYKVITPIDND